VTTTQTPRERVAPIIRRALLLNEGASFALREVDALAHEYADRIIASLAEEGFVYLPEEFHKQQKRIQQAQKRIRAEAKKAKAFIESGGRIPGREFRIDDHQPAPPADRGGE
jgi:hypothetical protein